MTLPLWTAGRRPFRHRAMVRRPHGARKGPALVTSGKPPGRRLRPLRFLRSDDESASAGKVEREALPGADRVRQESPIRGPLGPKRALKLSMSGSSGSGSTGRTGLVTEPCSTSQSTDSCAPATSSKSGWATLSAAVAFALERSSSDARLKDPPNSSCSNQHPWLARRSAILDDYALPSRTDHARHISTRQYGRLNDEWVTGIGLRREDYGRTRFDGSRHRSSTSKPATCAPCRSCLGTRRSKARCATSASMSRTRSRWPTAPKSDVLTVAVGRRFRTDVRVIAPECASRGLLASDIAGSPAAKSAIVNEGLPANGSIACHRALARQSQRPQRVQCYATSHCIGWP